MSPHSKTQSGWRSTKWLWVLLAICLIGWRVGSRVEQYLPSVGSAQHQAQVVFFDANDRNISLIDAARSQPHVVYQHTDRVLPVAELKVAADPVVSREREIKTVFPRTYVDSIALFSNPPPTLLN